MGTNNFKYTWYALNYHLNIIESDYNLDKIPILKKNHNKHEMSLTDFQFSNNTKLHCWRLYQVKLDSQHKNPQEYNKIHQFQYP